MVFAIVSLTIVLLVAGVVLYLVLQNSTGRTDKFFGETMEAWRNKELKNTDFEVKITRGSVADVFDTFQRDDGDGYLTVDEINAAVQGVAAYAPKMMHKNTDAENDSDSQLNSQIEIDKDSVDETADNHPIEGTDETEFETGSATQSSDDTDDSLTTKE